MKKFNISLGGLYAKVELSRESPKARTVRELIQFRIGNVYFSGDYENWSAAKSDASGYDAPAILEKVVSATRSVRDGTASYERDSVLFYKPAVSHPLFSWLMYAAGREGNALRVMDFGGALGSAYFQHRHLLAHVGSLKWGVIEQGHYVDAGRQEFESAVLRYFYSPEECVAAIQPNFGLVSGVLQYLEDPYGMLEVLLSKGLPYVLIDRTTAHRFGRDRLAIQHVPASIYKESLPIWLLDADRIESIFNIHHYEVMDIFDPHPGTLVGMDGFEAPYVGWFLRKKK
jgi:putative methyltransferase (TIGR04325 family)